MKNKKYTLFVFLLSLAPSIVMGAVSDELKRFNKCYALFVGERVKTSDALWIDVDTGKKSGTTACMEIFDKATLGTKGEIAKSSDPSNDIGAKVLNTFMRFQQSQFQVGDYSKVLEGPDEPTRDVIDINEAAYHFVYSLFSPGQKFSDIVTRDYSLRAIRYSAHKRTRSLLNRALEELEQGTYVFQPRKFMSSLLVPEDVDPFKVTFADTGILIGMERDDIKNTITNPSLTKKYVFNDYNVNQHIGSGAVGTQAYLMGNIGKDDPSDGALELYRRWGKHVMEDFLCRELPALRSSDVLSEVNIASKIPYRNGISCMGCHSSMDPLASVLRNGKIGWSLSPRFKNERVKFFGQLAPTLGFAEIPVLDRDLNFSKRPANGRLFYRSYDGSLVKQEMVGVKELGPNMAATNDLYVCAAKRYYKFLTGISVNLNDPGNINSPELSEGAVFQKNKVIQMGLDLKKHQSGRSLIKAIIEQKAFIYPDQGV